MGTQPGKWWSSGTMAIPRPAVGWPKWACSSSGGGGGGSGGDTLPGRCCWWLFLWFGSVWWEWWVGPSVRDNGDGGADWQNIKFV